jgi:hypothetical protein
VIASLAIPGNSYTYVYPLDPFNHSINSGSWIQGKPGLTNSKSVRDALHKLEGLVITVPVWDTSTGTGNNTLYHIIGFAQVQITGYVKGLDTVTITVTGDPEADAYLITPYAGGASLCRRGARTSQCHRCLWRPFRRHLLPLVLVP